MRIERLKNEKIKGFIDYCKRYRGGFNSGAQLGDKDLENFKPNEENPTYILINENNKIVGAVSLIIDEYYKENKTGEFRIFHSAIEEKEPYKQMFEAIVQHTEGLNDVFLFIKEEDKKRAEILNELKFQLQIYSVELIREDVDIVEATFPEEFQLRQFQANKDEEDWCEVRNIGFGEKEGIRTPDTVSQYWENDGDLHLDGGMMILYHKDNPVGTVRASKWIENGEICTYISVVCVKPEYRGMGLGKNLLRAAVSYGKSQGFPKALLDVDSENKKAFDLYLSEGFKEVTASVLYSYDFK